ncbi:hypothetical protein ACWDWS_31035 [Streptomyces sp. NPDC003328]|uniref:hypothetical protein n=1 Tax=unclassified Streptomyces TaxID=2593676 RepID=UPI001F48BF7C|nr:MULTISPECIES: hypothetical protein [unclassified Streptomyces]
MTEHTAVTHHPIRQDPCLLCVDIERVPRAFRLINDTDVLRAIVEQNSSHGHL